MEADEYTSGLWVLNNDSRSYSFMAIMTVAQYITIVQIIKICQYIIMLDIFFFTLQLHFNSYKTFIK